MALPDYTFIDGFDKYGAATSDITAGAYRAALITGEWSSADNAGAAGPVTSLSAGGVAMGWGNTGAGGTFDLRKNLPSTYARCVGGATIKDLPFSDSGSQKGGIVFFDSTTAQLSISQSSLGKLQIYRGSTNGGTLLATATTIFSAGNIYCLEWDITFHGSAGIVKIWINGVQETALTLTGANTAPSGNNRFDGMALRSGNAVVTSWDHLYLWCYTSSGGTETPCLTNPIVETHFTTGDAQKQWTTGPGIIGKKISASGTTASPGANQLYLMKYRCEASGTLNSIGLLTYTTSATAKLKGVVYADSSGAPGTLMSSGTEVVGTTTGTTLTLPLVTPQSLTAGTDYWIGYIVDTSVNMGRLDTLASGYRASNTYTSGAPSPAPTMTASQASLVMWGNMTGITVNWSQENDGQYASDVAYNYSATVGQEDLYTFDNLSSVPTNIYTVAVKALVQRVGSGVRTVDLHTKSGATDATGSMSAQSVPASLTEYASYFNVDPNTSAAWGYSGVNAATHGVKIVS